MQTTILNMTEIKDINLATILQSTFEFNKLLELFDDEISALVKHHGLTYWNKEEDHSITFGI